jgi:hypothetical protein
MARKGVAFGTVSDFKLNAFPKSGEDHNKP